MSAELESLFAVIRDSAEKRVWSQGVELARNGDFSNEPGADAGEFALRIISGSKDKAPRVYLSPESETWQCDCDESDDPCRHVVAAVIALRQGKLSAPRASGATAALGRVVYSLSRQDGALSFGRYIDVGGERNIVEKTLRETVDALTSKGNLRVLVQQEDYSIEHILVRRKHGILEPETMRLLIPALEKLPYIEFEGAAIRVSSEVLEIALTLSKEDGGYRLRFADRSGVTENFINGVALGPTGLQPLKEERLTAEEFTAFSGAGTLIPENSKITLFSEVLPKLERRVKILRTGSGLPFSRVLEPHIQLQCNADEGGASLVVVPKLIYGDPPVAEIERDKLLVLSDFDIPVRNRAAESNLSQQLASELDMRIGEGKVFLGEQAINFISRDVSIRKMGDGLSKFRPVDLVKDVVQSGEGFTVNFSSSEGEVSFEKAYESFRSGNRFVQLSDGAWGALPVDWLSMHGKALANLLAARDERGAIPSFRALEASEVFEAAGLERPASVRDFAEALRKGELPGAALPADLKAELRPYQKQGIDWLSFLLSHEVGALLADDMGLGKTLQAMCVIEGRTLIVCPTSVVHSWRDQLERFRPGLSVSIYHGAARKLDMKSSVVISTYPILRLDAEVLQKEEWQMLVLDEAQVIKNPRSQIAAAAHGLKARRRLILSGTPVENNLNDLWSQFRVINPYLLGSLNDFERDWIEPISSGKTDFALRLRTKIRPFVLRRLKSEVVKDLPPRTDVTLEVELSEEERRLYETLKLTTRQEILSSVESSRGLFSVLESLLRLRQACCHSALVPGGGIRSSSKLDLLVSSLETSIAEGHRALVFSQWTALLDLVETSFAERGISFSRLDGATKDRERVVSDFQSPNGPSVMLLSLKAGGVGITLTAADHVYILDPWWNPAVEEQAAGRAHRIGQTDPVFVFKLVAKDTIEERIIELQKNKKDLMQAMMNGTDNFLLTKEEILGLL